jgi:hypothetical protein
VAEGYYNREELAVAEILFSNFCSLGVSSELHSVQGSNFSSRLTQEILQRL